MFLYSLLAWLPLVLADSSTVGPIDLSHFFDDNTIYWLNSSPFEFIKVVTRTGAKDDFFNSANEFQAAEHGGTHINAPYHYYRDGWKVGDIPVDRFIGNAVYLDLRAKAAENADYQVLPEDFEQWEAKYGPMPKHSIVMLDFGWANKYYKNKKTLFFGTKDIKNFTSFHFPGLSEEGAQWLIDTGRVYGVGTDTASIDYGGSMQFKTHRLLAKHSLFILEQLAFPEKAPALPPRDYKVLALPMKIREGTGAPCRVLALSSQQLGPQYL